MKSATLAALAIAAGVQAQQELGAVQSNLYHGLQRAYPHEYAYPRAYYSGDHSYPHYYDNSESNDAELQEEQANVISAPSKLQFVSAPPAAQPPANQPPAAQPYQQLYQAQPQ